MSDQHRSAKTPVGEASDPYDPNEFRVGSLTDIAVEKMLSTIPVRRPGRTEFFRVHPEWAADKYLVERSVEMDRESYLVNTKVAELVLTELRPVRLFPCINKRGTVFLWPAKLPRGDTNESARRWMDTALQAAEEAKHLWVRMFGNRDLGGYEIFRAKGDLGEPQWPDKTFRELIEIAFRDRVIDRVDHEVIKELNGEL